MSIRTYDAEDCTIVVDGRATVGVSEGSFVTCEKSEDNYEPYVGAKGEVVRAKKHHPIGTISVTLEATSPSNGWYLQKANSDRMFAIRMVYSGEGTVTVGGSKAWVQKPGNVERGGETPETEWVFVVADYEVK